MSARALLRWVLVLQVAALAAIAWLVKANGITGSWLLAAACGASAVLVVRILITANNFVMTARFASPTPDDYRLGAFGRLRLFAEEFMATLLHSSWFMARAVAHQRLYPDSRSVPLLLLHGYGCNSGYWAHLTRLLDEARLSHAALDLEPIMGAIDDYVPLVERAVEELCARSGAGQVIIVAHSMGGLVARAYLRAHGATRIRHVFTLGTPHHGTSLAKMGPGKNAAQMRRDPHATGGPESAWLRALAEAETPQTRALITSLYTHHDNIVAPQTSSQLDGARNIAFGGVGHVALGRNPRVLARLMQEIALLFIRQH